MNQNSLITYTANTYTRKFTISSFLYRTPFKLVFLSNFYWLIMRADKFPPHLRNFFSDRERHIMWRIIAEIHQILSLKRRAEF